MQQSLKRGTFAEEIVRLQGQLQDPALTPAQHKKLAARLANRVEKHNRNIDDATQSYDRYAAILQHLQAGQPVTALTSKQLYTLNNICDPFNPILRYCGVKRTADDYTTEQLIVLLRKKLNSSNAVRKYKTRTKV